MKGDLITKILLVIVSLLLVFNLIKSKGSENVAWGESNRTVVAGAAFPREVKTLGGASPMIFRFWSDGAVDVAILFRGSKGPRMPYPWRTLK